MGVLDRMSQVISSNFNALLDRFDDPAKNTAQLLSDMREQISLAERELIRVMGEKKRIEARQTELVAEARRWESRAELAVRSGEDALAREALVQKRRVDGERSRLLSVAEEQRAAATAMKLELQRMRQKFDDYSSRKNTIFAEVAIGRAGGGVEALGARPGARSPFEALRRIEAEVDGVEAMASATAEVQRVLEDGGPSGMARWEVEARFSELERTEGTNERREGASSVERTDGEGAPSGELPPPPRVRIEI